MAINLQIGDRIEMYPGEEISYRADVVKVAKNGSVKVERWFQKMRCGEPTLIREWLPSYIVKNAVVIRKA